MRRNLLAIVAVSTLVACSTRTWPNVTSTPSGAELALARRPADCKIEFYRTRPPDRPYDEVAALHFEGSIASTPAVAHGMLRREACALGADAIFVTHEFLPASLVMEATALSYRDTREKHRADAAQRKAAGDAQPVEARHPGDAAEAPPLTAAAAAAKEEHARKNGRPRAAGYVQAFTHGTVIVHSIADRQGDEVDVLGNGVWLWVASKPSGGWRKVWLIDDRKGWVDDTSIEVR
jgi:hypothetical protein